MSRKNLSSTIIQLIGARPILFNPLLAKKPSNITNAVFLSQLLYWQSTKPSSANIPENWFYKSIEELEGETMLSPYQQRKASEFWQEMGVIRYELRGLPPKRWFWIDTKGVVAFINSTNNRAIGVTEDGVTRAPYYEDIDKMYGNKRRKIQPE